MRACLIDVRCLQDPAYAERGIGRHAGVLLAHARAALPETRLIGLADRNLPALAPGLRAHLDELKHGAYTGALRRPTVHVQLSPMTHDPLFTARLLLHQSIPSACALYDFIPHDEPERYLPRSASRIEYAVALRWLARYQMFCPISRHAADRLHALLNVPAARIAVTGAPLAPAFETVPPRTPAHILVIGGGDPRKNPEAAIRAHATSRRLQQARVPLVVTGSYGPEWLERQRGGVAALGGDPELIEMAGHVDEAALLALYAGAFCVVAPSRAEGFSLPVLEAMGAGVPVLASDIPAHRELLDDGLFAPDDHDALAALLDPALDSAWRERRVQKYAATWPRFRAAAVAERFWTGVGRLVPGAAPATPRHRPRVAFLTPLPPDSSGVAEFSFATCPELAKRVDLHVFTPTRDPAVPSGVTSVEPLSARPVLSAGFDRVVHVLGNSTYHLAILHLFRRYGGAAIMHDGRMLDLYAAHIDLDHTIRMAEAEVKRTLRPNEMWHWLAGDQPPKATILAELAEAEPLMFHSRAAVAEVQRLHNRTARHLPFGLYRHIPDALFGPAERMAARARIGVAPGTLLIATFGFVHHSKAPLDCLWALELLRSWNIDARLHFVGSSLVDRKVWQAWLHELGLEPYVFAPDRFLDEETYRDHLVGADAAVQLRTIGVGSVSGALADCIAAGLPSVASETLAEAIDAPEFVVRVPDNPSPVLVAEALAGMLGRRAPEDERRAYIESHGFDRYATRLCEALELP